MSYCSDCNVSCYGARFCPSCGRQIAWGGNELAGCGVLLLLGFCCCGGGGFFVNNNQQTQQQQQQVANNQLGGNNNVVNNQIGGGNGFGGGNNQAGGNPPINGKDNTTKPDKNKKDVPPDNNPPDRKDQDKKDQDKKDQSAPKNRPNLNGVWTGQMIQKGATIPAVVTMTLRQNGDKFTGTSRVHFQQVKGPYAVMNLEGSCDGDTLTFTEISFAENRSTKQVSFILKKGSLTVNPAGTVMSGSWEPATARANGGQMELRKQ